MFLMVTFLNFELLNEFLIMDFLGNFAVFSQAFA